MSASLYCKSMAIEDDPSSDKEAVNLEYLREYTNSLFASIASINSTLSALTATVQSLTSAINSLPSLIVNEIPSGLINNTNDIYTTGSAYMPGTLVVYYNGARLMPSSVTELSSTQYQTSFKPLTDSTLTNDYLKAA